MTNDEEKTENERPEREWDLEIRKWMSEKDIPNDSRFSSRAEEEEAWELQEEREIEAFEELVEIQSKTTEIKTLLSGGKPVEPEKDHPTKSIRQQLAIARGGTEGR